MVSALILSNATARWVMLWLGSGRLTAASVEREAEEFWELAIFLSSRAGTYVNGLVITLGGCSSIDPIVGCCTAFRKISLFYH
jgi:hypothetical protein